MIRAGLLALVLAGPAGAEGLAGDALCNAAWTKLAEGLGVLGSVSAASVGQDGDWCVAEALVLDMAGQYLPDWHVDRLRVRGAAVVSVKMFHLGRLVAESCWMASGVSGWPQCLAA